MFVIACLRVHDDVEDWTFDVKLADVVKMMDDPYAPGKHHSLIIALLNAEILDRHPHAAGIGNWPLTVTMDEFSDLKFQVMQKLLAWVKPSGGVAVQ